MGIGRRGLLAAGLVAAVGGCVSVPTADPAVIRETPPPWPAPRDTVSYIDRAGLPRLPLDAKDNQRVFTLSVFRAGAPVEVPAYLGIDRLRAFQAPCHTHDTSGTVWLEGKGVDEVTLGQLFDVWGVRFDGTCLGDLCGSVRVVVDGQAVTDARGLRLAGVTQSVEVRADSA